MNTRNYIDLAVIIGLVAVLSLLGYISHQVKAEGYECQLNPLVYASQKLSEVNNDHFYGYGHFIGKSGLTVKFDENNMTVELPQDKRVQQIIDYNFSMFK